MNSILVVDDEKWIRKGIIAKLKHHGFEFSDIKEAADGEQALEIIKNEHPHIVLVDIKMPHMDGIELIKQTKKIHPDIEFIIITGYAEFEYAEQALNMGVVGYILKPVDDDNLVGSIGKVIKKLDDKKSVSNIKDTKDDIEKDREMLLLERKLNHLLHDYSVLDNDKEAVDLCMEEFFNGGNYILVLLNIDGVSYQQSDFQYQDIDIIKFGVKNILDEIGAKYQVTVFDNYENKNQLLIILYHTNENVLQKNCDRFIYDAYSKVTKYLKLSVTIAASSIKKEITGKLYREAKAAFDLRLLNGSSNIYRYDKMTDGKEYNFPVSKLKLLEKYMDLFDFSNIKVILDNIFNIDNFEYASSVHFRLVYFEVVSLIVKVLSKQGIDVYKTVDSAVLSGEILDGYDNADEIAGFIYCTIENALKNKDSVLTNCKDIVARVINYLNEHYDEDIKVKDLAGKFAVNPNYFSTVFKKETGRGITKYIRNIRLKNACRLLKETEANIAMISESVGYSDTQYFYRIFKRETGVTPMEYKKQYME